MSEENELSPEEMKFLQEWELLGADGNAEVVQGGDFDFGALEVDPEDTPNDDAEVIVNHDGDHEDDGEIDPDAAGGDAADDAGQMDIGNQDEDRIENHENDPADEADHLEGGEAPDDIPEGEDDLDYDGLDERDDEEKGEPEYEADQEADEAGDKAEADDGEGERGNSDEERESEDPIEHTPQADAEEEAPEGHDAQEELENHLQEQPVDEENSPEQPESPPEKPQDGQGKGQGKYADLPESPQGCDDHCEDHNPDEADGPECPHCTERIRREREEWGVIGKDKDGADILPGDKLQVQIPISFAMQGTLLTTNVPNLEEERFAETTGGEALKDLMWLSGRISEFTGTHMAKGGSIWTFKKGDKLKFVKKVGSITGELQGNQNPEELVEDLMEDLANFGGEEDPKPEPEAEEEVEEEDIEEAARRIQENIDRQKEELEAAEDSPDEEDDEANDEADEDDLNDVDRGDSQLTGTQLKRYNNIFERLEKKILGTFGHTVESHNTGEMIHRGEFVARPLTIVSRGVAYTFVLTAKRSE